MKLNVLICCFEQGIHGIADSLPMPDPHVLYFISYQGRQEKLEKIPDKLENRKDVLVSILPGVGLSKNRNNVIRLALKTRAVGYFLIADEDVTFLHGFRDSITTAFEKRPDVDIICFKIKTVGSDIPFKPYGLLEKKVTLWSVDRISSIEIAGKMKVLEELLFDERLGVGAEFPSGEETAFLADAIRMGLSVWYVPEYIVEHALESSGKRFRDQWDIKSLHVVGGRAFRIYGGVIARLFFLYSAVKNYRKYNNDISFLAYFNALNNGLSQFKDNSNA